MAPLRSFFQAFVRDNLLKQRPYKGLCMQSIACMRRLCPMVACCSRESTVQVCNKRSAASLCKSCIYIYALCGYLWMPSGTSPQPHQNLWNQFKPLRNLSGTLPKHLEPIQMLSGTFPEPPGTFQNLFGTLPEPLEPIQMLSGTFRNLPEPLRNLAGTSGTNSNAFWNLAEPPGTFRNFSLRNLGPQAAGCILH